jgi:hypothetical protein
LHTAKESKAKQMYRPEEARTPEVPTPHDDIMRRLRRRQIDVIAKALAK